MSNETNDACSSSSNDKSIDGRHVIIPNNGTKGDQFNSGGFQMYNRLAKINTEEYHNLPMTKGIKYQYVIEKVINPILDDNRNFYRYNKEKECYELVDLINEEKFKEFAKNVVMQKMRDAVREMKNERKRSSQSNLSAKVMNREVNKKMNE